MTRCTLFLTAALLALASCSTHTAPMPALAPAQDSRADCSPLFPRGNFQFVHFIEFSMPANRRGSAMGVTVLHGDTIKSVLMTVEGFVLFAAESGDTLHVTRAVPPFDKPDFAHAMIKDIQTIFLLPRGTRASGILPGDGPVCRITEDSGAVTDILSTGSCRELHLYSPHHLLQTTITGSDCSRQLGSAMLPEILELTSLQMGGYSLKMTLLNAEEISHEQTAAP